MRGPNVSVIGNDDDERSLIQFHFGVLTFLIDLQLHISLR